MMKRYNWTTILVACLFAVAIILVAFGLDRALSQKSPVDSEEPFFEIIEECTADGTYLMVLHDKETDVLYFYKISTGISPILNPDGTPQTFAQRYGSAMTDNK